MGLKGGPTQDEIMAVSLFKLNIEEGDVMADIGCGTAKISIEASKKCSNVYAIDRRAEAVDYAKSEIEKAGRENIILIHGEASTALEDIGALDCAFVGGPEISRLFLKNLNLLYPEEL